MIIRRRHTANFTTIGNVLFEDERLEADEVGVLAYLLSRPNDWEVRRPQLARRFHVGRESIKRIIFNSMRFGWVIAKKTRLSNGTYHTIYEVRDQPGPELSPEKVRDALSLVSSEAPDVGEGDGADPTPTYGGVSETGPPATAQPEPVSQLRQTRRGSYKEELLNTDSQSTHPPTGAGAFASLQALWPIGHILSLIEAEAAFAGLTEGSKKAAIEGAEPYLADCRANTRKICDLSTYLRGHRWDRFTAVKPAQAAAARVETRPGTAQWFRWHEYNTATDPAAARLMSSWSTQGRGWWAPSEWPPAFPQKPVAPSPPTELMTDEDIREFAENG